jgi:hypothetical protein
MMLTICLETGELKHTRVFDLEGNKIVLARIRIKVNRCSVMEE